MNWKKKKKKSPIFFFNERQSFWRKKKKCTFLSESHLNSLSCVVFPDKIFAINWSKSLKWRDKSKEDLSSFIQRGAKIATRFLFVCVCVCIFKETDHRSHSFSETGLS